MPKDKTEDTFQEEILKECWDGDWEELDERPTGKTEKEQTREFIDMMIKRAISLTKQKSDEEFNEKLDNAYKSVKENHDKQLKQQKQKFIELIDNHGKPITDYVIVDNWSFQEFRDHLLTELKQKIMEEK